MNKQQRNQLTRRRNQQQLKAHEFMVPTSRIDIPVSQDNDRGKYSTSHLAELAYRITRYKALSQEERRDAEVARMKDNAILEAELRNSFPDAHMCCLW